MQVLKAVVDRTLADVQLSRDALAAVFLMLVPELLKVGPGDAFASGGFPKPLGARLKGWIETAHQRISRHRGAICLGLRSMAAVPKCSCSRGGRLATL